MTEPRSNLDRD